MTKFPPALTALAILAATAALLLPPAPLAAQTTAPQPLLIDASAPTPQPGPANYTYSPADAKSPDGRVLGLNSQYLTLDGKPWLPVMGEIHYSRVPEAEWETEILKMKSAGVQVIAAYIIWIHHEEVEGQWDWSGNKDLRRFVQLCAKHGMYVVPRIGPWSHAEVRNGGFPDWLLTKTNQTRSNDPTYLHYVDLYYQQIAAQLKGLIWSEGGPVIAIQLENEYRGSGPNRGVPHILKLKEMAQADGMRVPFFTVTGWDGASIPHGAVLPVYGGYPDAPWDASINKLSPSEVYNFRFNSRVTGDMGAIGATQAPTGNAANFTRDTPFITAEMGGGMQVTYHRRPIVSPDDIAAMMPVELGSGVNLYGTYMFHGGENPDGKLTTLQESLATHYANDLPEKSYDFQAPIGEFGDERESLLKLKTWNYFLNDFGPILAPMQPHAPATLPTGPRDFSIPRIAARTSGSSGFLFVNNHVREYPMPARPNFQVTIKLPGDKSVTLPSQPITLPADAYFVWPFNLDLSGLHLRFATAQPLAILGTKDAPVYAFFAQPNIPAEFVIDDTPGLAIAPAYSPRERQHTPNHIVLPKGTASAVPQTGSSTSTALAPEGKACTASPERHDDALWLHDLTPGPDCLLHFSVHGRSVNILLLAQPNAEQSWKIAANGTTNLLMTPQQVFIDNNVAILQSLGSDAFTARLLVPGQSLRPGNPNTEIQIAGKALIATIRATSAERVNLIPTQIQPASSPAPLPADFKPSSRPRVVAAAPTDADFSRAATYSIPIPKSALTGTPAEQHFLRITYSGDVARLTIPADGKPRLLDDNFADGRPWLVGLTRFDPLLQTNPTLDLAIYPLRPNPPIFFEPGSEPKPGATLQSVELLTQYTLKLNLVPTPTKQR